MQVDSRRKRRSNPGAADNWLDAGVELREHADRMQRTTETVLAPFGLTRIQFLVLRATAARRRRLGDAVSQREIAAEARIGEMRTSRAMRALAQRGLVDRGPSATCLAYRVTMTARGRKTLRDCRDQLATVRVALEIAGSG
jgi:DNA-binding MarR family transcriptional regulator